MTLDALRLESWRALDAVFPRRCRLCGDAADDALACGSHALPRRPRGARCARCEAALAPALPHGAICPACRLRPPPFERVVALGDYEDLRAWTLAFKYGGRVELAAPFGALLARRAREERIAVDPNAWLVPVPLHPLRRLERGYDQAARLAAECAARLGRTAQPVLSRRRFALPQGALGAAPRHRNVAGAFRVERCFARRLRGRACVLVDDVLTSGATLAEAARTLRRGGATRVDALVLARATGGTLGASV